MEPAGLYAMLVDEGQPTGTVVLLRRTVDDAHIFFVADNATLPEDLEERGGCILGRIEGVKRKTVFRIEGQEMGVAHVVGQVPDHIQIDTIVCINIGACKGIPESEWSHTEPFPVANWFPRAAAA